MTKFGIGDLVGYGKESKEWKIVKIEIVEGKHSEDVLYTLKKVSGQDLGKKVTTDAESIL